MFHSGFTEMDSLNVNLNELELVAEKIKERTKPYFEILENKDDDRFCRIFQIFASESNIINI